MNSLMTIPLPSALARQIGISRALFGLAVAAVWLHLVDAALVQPQANASWGEHLVQGVLAVAAVPIAVLASERTGPVGRGVMTMGAGLVALSTGGAKHVASVVRSGEWSGTDFTGVPMAIAGLVILAIGLTRLTTMIPRARYRWLMAPAVFLGLLFVVAPVAGGVFVTHAPRPTIEARDLGASYEQVSFETTDGLTLFGWYVPSRNGAAIALMHGSGSSRLGSVEHARILVRHGYGVLLYDSRGHGESDGDTVTLGWGAYSDGIAAAAYLAGRADVDPTRIGALGVSMGAELALEAAAHDDLYAAIVADGPSGRTFADLHDAGLSMLERVVSYPSTLVFDLTVATLSAERPAAALTSLSPQVTEPVLYIASGQVAIERSLVTKIAEASAGDYELWIIDEAGHGRGLQDVPAEYERRVVGFFDQTLLRGGGTRPPTSTD